MIGFFYFSRLGWKVQGSISGNIRRAFYWENIRKSFFWENIGKVFYRENINIFLILELESSISKNKKIFVRGEFFWGFFWTLASFVQGSISRNIRNLLIVE